MREFTNSKGRGTISEPGNRFEAHSIELDPGAFEEIAANDPNFEPRRTETKCFSDDSQSIISNNTSPDLGFSFSLNPYRGCEHGCSYCYARPYHEYLGFNAGLDFETRLMVKRNAPDLLERELAKSSWKPATLICSGVTDCFQPIERQFKITRECIRVLKDFRNPIGIVTKNALVTRDIDYLAEMAAYGASVVAISLTTLDAELAGNLEPRASRPLARLKAIRELHEAGIPVGISLAPVIPGINDHEIPAILEAAKDYGAQFAGYSVIRLPFGVGEIFADWLETHYPNKKKTVFGRIREMRDGKLNDSDFGSRMIGKGIIAEQIKTMFEVAHRRAKIPRGVESLNTSHFQRRIPGQMELFD